MQFTDTVYKTKVPGTKHLKKRTTEATADEEMLKQIWMKKNEYGLDMLHMTNVANV